MKREHIKEMIARHFFLHPTEKLRVRQIERDAGVPLPSAVRYAKDLEKEGILKKTVIGGSTFYSADRSSKRFIRKKMLFNLSSLFQSGIVDHLMKELSNPTIVCFGSYAKGEDIEGSDIDFYIESASRRKIPLGEYEKRLGRRIQVFQFRGIKDVKNRELANNIVNGIVLNGFLEVFE